MTTRAALLLALASAALTGCGRATVTPPAKVSALPTEQPEFKTSTSSGRAQYATAASTLQGD